MSLSLDQLAAHLQGAANSAAVTFGALKAGSVVPVDDPTPALPDGPVRIVRVAVVEGGLELALALADEFAAAALEGVGTTDLAQAVSPVLHAAAAELAMQGDVAVDLAAAFETPTGQTGPIWGPDGTQYLTAGLFLGDEQGEQVGNIFFLFVPEPVAAPSDGATGDDGIPTSSVSGARDDIAVASFAEIGAGAAASGTNPLAMLRGVEMKVTAELGRAKLPVSNLLALGTGSIVELDRAAGTPVDVLVNGTVIAHGEVVVIDEEYGVRITDIVGANPVANPVGANGAGEHR